MREVRHSPLAHGTPQFDRERTGGRDGLQLLTPEGFVSSEILAIPPVDVVLERCLRYLIDRLRLDEVPIEPFDLTQDPRLTRSVHQGVVSAPKELVPLFFQTSEMESPQRCLGLRESLFVVPTQTGLTFERSLLFARSAPVLVLKRNIDALPDHLRRFITRRFAKACPQRSVTFRDLRPTLTERVDIKILCDLENDLHVVEPRLFPMQGLEQDAPLCRRQRVRAPDPASS